MRTPATFTVLALLLLPCPLLAEPRPMQIDDLFRLHRLADPQISPDGSRVVYVQTTILDPAQNKSRSRLMLAPLDHSAPPRELTTTDKKDRHPRWSPDGTKILFESNRSGSTQLWVIDPRGGEARQLTTIATEAGNALWSPDGSRIAFVSAIFPEYAGKPFAEADKLSRERLDALEKSPVKVRTADRLFFRHWDSYVEGKRLHLFVMDADGQNPRDVTPGDRDASPTSSTFESGDNFTFSPDGKHLIFTAVPAQGEAWSTNYDICRVDIANPSSPWEVLRPGNPAADNAPSLSPDRSRLAFRAQKKAGYEADKWDIHVVPIRPDGTFQGTPRNLTEGVDVTVGDYVWLSDDRMAFTADDRGSTPIFELTLPAGDQKSVIRRLPIPGMNGSLSAAPARTLGPQFVFTNANLNRPAEVMTVNLARGGLAGDDRSALKPIVISRANDALLAEIIQVRPESVEVPVEGGVSMQMWVLKPPKFDPAKKWPVAYLVHGGPQGAWEDGWSFRWCPQLWAAQGYIVVLPNPRGSTGFGQKFCDDISGDWGGKCYRDLMAGVDHVVKWPYVDPNRIGTAGASFGGYMMNWFAVSTGRFACLITHCSVWNFESMWGTTDELWFDEWEHQGLPWDVPGRYREFSPHVRAKALGQFKTPMLVIHNDLDFRCPVGQGLELFTALQRQGVPSRLINFPDEGHWVLKPANSRLWHEEVFAWLKKYVPPGPR